MAQPVPTRLHAAAVRAWAEASLAALGEERAAIDALNVFPVPDGDTGTNMFLTVESACASIDEVFDDAEARDTRPATADVAAASARAQVPPVEPLRLAIEALLSDLLRSGHASLFSRLVARELIEPTAAIHKLAERNVRPQHALFTGLIRGVVGPAMPDDVVQKCVFSVIGQAVFYARSRIVHELVVPEMTYDEAGIAR